MSPVDLGWVAGLIEGEGSFLLLHRHQGTKWSPRISMQSTDLDVLERLVAVTGVGRVSKVGARPNRKPCWQWAVAVYADALWLMKEVRPLMGVRRQHAINEVLEGLSANEEKKR